jgi:hypothetical protein
VNADDRLISAWLAGTGRKLARSGVAPDDAEAVAELREVARGRDDLLTYRAGIALGFGGDDATDKLEAALYLAALSGPLDNELLADSIRVGQGRADRTRAIPATTGHRRRG